MPVINWIVRFIGLGLLVLFQIFVLNSLNINPYIHPYVYPMFLIIFPFDVPRWVYLPVAFGTGLLMDMFTNTPGMHAAACVFIAYIRPIAVKLFTPVSGYENIEFPSIEQLGFIWYLLFTLTLIFMHHTVYYILHTFSYGHFGYAMLKTLISTAVSTTLILILAYLFTSRKTKR